MKGDATAADKTSARSVGFNPRPSSMKGDAPRAQIPELHSNLDSLARTPTRGYLQLAFDLDYSDKTHWFQQLESRANLPVTNPSLQVRAQITIQGARRNL